MIETELQIPDSLTVDARCPFHGTTVVEVREGESSRTDRLIKTHSSRPDHNPPQPSNLAAKSLDICKTVGDNHLLTPHPFPVSGTVAIVARRCSDMRCTALEAANP